MGTNQRVRPGSINGHGGSGDLGAGSENRLAGTSESCVAEGSGASHGRDGGEAPGAGASDYRAVKPADLASLIPGRDALVRSVPIDSEFIRCYPRLWTCLTAGKRVGGDKDRATGELAVRIDGAVWLITLTMPEELLSIGAESELPSNLFAALETRLSLEPIPWRKASRFAKRKQLSPDKKEVAK